MNPCSIVFSKDDKSNYDGVVLWQEKYGILKKSYLFKLCFVIDLFGAFLSFFSMYFEDDFSLVGTILFVILEVVLFTFITLRIVKNKIVPEIARRGNIRIKANGNKTEITLRENDFEIKTQYTKANYFYDEIEAFFDRGSYEMIVVDKELYPIIVSFRELLEGDRESFKKILSEKLSSVKERWEK